LTPSGHNVVEAMPERRAFSWRASADQFLAALVPSRGPSETLPKAA